MAERSMGLNPNKVNEKRGPIKNVDKFRAISDEATAYNLRDDLVSEIAMDYLRSEAKRISDEIKKKKRPR